MIFQPSPPRHNSVTPSNWALPGPMPVPSRWVVQSDGRKGIATFTEERIAVEGKAGSIRKNLGCYPLVMGIKNHHVTNMTMSYI